MSDKKGEAEPLRRDFMKLAGLGAVGGAVALVSGTEPATAKDAESTGSGYRETAHVKQVYALSRF